MALSLLTLFSAARVDVRLVNRSLFAPSPAAWKAATQCAPGRAIAIGSQPRPFAFSPARTRLANGRPGATVLPLLLVGDPRWSAKKGLFNVSTLANWHRRMLSPHSITLLLLLARRFTVENLPQALEYARRLGLMPLACNSSAVAGDCAALVSVDEGYVAYTYDDDPTDTIWPSTVLMGVITGARLWPL
ncbi:hypothetical protein T492DRAFT_947320 [Pavlovales sp. CCMP2436]|nr:hypothetical protein T492DRAFT_947320 [Pavlovales sp. CCMP2436]